MKTWQQTQREAYYFYHPMPKKQPQPFLAFMIVLLVALLWAYVLWM